MLIVMGATLATVTLVVGVAPGRALKAIRDDDGAAACVGIHVPNTRPKAWLLAALFPALAGGIEAWYTNVVDPEYAFHVLITAKSIIYAMAGGFGTILGPVVGTLALLGIDHVIWQKFPVVNLLLLGLIIVLLMLFLPRGIVGSLIKRKPCAPLPEDYPTGLIIQGLMNGLILGAIYGLIGVGLNVVFGVLRVVNFAHGEFLVLGAYFAFYLMEYAGINPLLALPLAFAAFFLAGYLLYFVLIPRLNKADDPEISSLLLMFGVSIMLGALMLLAFDADARSLPYEIEPVFLKFRAGADSPPCACRRWSSRSPSSAA